MPPSDEEWRTLIESEMARRPPPVTALVYLGRTYPSCSRPVLMGCSDGNDYVVKWFDPSRMVVNDQVIGVLGSAMDMPIPMVSLVEIVSELKRSEPGISHIPAGFCHGSRFLAGGSETGEPFRHTNLPDNRSRFAKLAVLYGWAFVGSDHQFLYRKQAPNLVFSHDHGHFFPGGPNWTPASLGRAPAPELDRTIMDKCFFTDAEISDAIQSLQRVGPAEIATAVARPPDTWGMALDERVALATYLDRRREQILAGNIF